MTNAPEGAHPGARPAVLRPGAQPAPRAVDRTRPAAQRRRLGPADPAQARPGRQPARLDRRPGRRLEGPRRDHRPGGRRPRGDALRRVADDPHRLRARRRRRSASSVRACSSTRRPTTAPTRLLKELPDAIDLLTISVESGLGFDAAVQQVARNTEGPLADEFARMLREMQIGQGRGDALRALADRTNLPDLRSFVSAMVQADSFGIPIAQVLRVQSAEMRVKRRQRAEEKAQQVPVKITIPLIFFILPCLFIAVMGPAVLSIIDNIERLDVPESLRRASIGARALRRRGSGGPPRPQPRARRADRASASWWSSGRSPACDPVPTTVLRTVAEAAVVGSLLRLRPAGRSPRPGGAGRGAVRRRARAAASGACRRPCPPSSSSSSGSRWPAVTSTQAQMLEMFSWMMTGVGLGLVASFVHSVMVVEDETRSAPTARPGR